MKPLDYLKQRTYSGTLSIKRDIAKGILEFIKEYSNLLEDEESIALWFNLYREGTMLVFRDFENSHKFFDLHYKEINNLVEQYVEVENKRFTLEPGDIKEQLAHWAFNTKVFNMEYDIIKCVIR